MNKKMNSSENLFNPNLVFEGNINNFLEGYPIRSKALERFASEGMSSKDLNVKFIKNGYYYLLRGAKNGQETGFYSREYANKNTIESLGIDPNAAAFAQYLNGDTPFISATTDLYTAASFSQNERIYILQMSIDDVYTFYQSDSLMEKEYMIPDYISANEIIRSFRYNKFKQIYNYLTNEIGLNITHEDLGIRETDLNFPNEEKIKDIRFFNEAGSNQYDPLLKLFQNAALSNNMENVIAEIDGKQILKKK